MLAICLDFTNFHSTRHSMLNRFLQLLIFIFLCTIHIFLYFFSLKFQNKLARTVCMLMFTIIITSQISPFLIIFCSKYITRLHVPRTNPLIFNHCSLHWLVLFSSVCFLYFFYEIIGSVSSDNSKIQKKKNTCSNHLKVELQSNLPYFASLKPFKSGMTILYFLKEPGNHQIGTT